MCRATQVAIGCLLTGLMLGGLTVAEDSEVSGARKIISRASATYPEMARKINLQGTVKLQVTVSPDGKAKSTRVIGGSPLLVKAAEDSLYRFRWAPAKEESQELIEIRFHLD